LRDLYYSLKIETFTRTAGMYVHRARADATRSPGYFRRLEEGGLIPAGHSPSLA